MQPTASTARSRDSDRGQNAAPLARLPQPEVAEPLDSIQDPAASRTKRGIATGGSDVLHLSPKKRRRDRRDRCRPGRVGSDELAIGVVLDPVDVDAATSLRPADVADDQLREGVGELARDLACNGLGPLERLTCGQRNGDMEPEPAGGFHDGLERERIEKLPGSERDSRAVDETRRRTGIEIEDEGGRFRRALDGPAERMELDRAEIG